MKYIYPPIKNLNMALNSKNVTLEEIMKDAKYSNDLGTYIIGKNKIFHGGLNLTVPSNHAVQSVADGKIIAYRITEENQELQIAGEKVQFSNCFILIEHNYSNLDRKIIYKKDLVRQHDESLQIVAVKQRENHGFEDYKFYSLYMHLLPINGISEQKYYPEWMFLNKSLNKTLEKGLKLNKNSLIFFKGFVFFNFNNKCIKFSEKEIVIINGEYYLNKTIDLYDTSGEVKDFYIQKNKTIILENDNQIIVEGGEILGYGGESQANSLNKTYKSTLHFEIWLDDITFMENKKIDLEYSIVPGIPKDLVVDDFETKFNQKIDQVVTEVNKRAFGYNYINKTKETLEQVSINYKRDDIKHLVVLREYVDDNFYFNFVPKEKFFTIEYSGDELVKKYKGKIRISSDADWFTKPIGNWLLKNQSDFFYKDGHFKLEYFKNNHNEWVKYNNKMVVKLEYNEWDSDFFKKKYNFLLSNTEGYPRLKQNQFSALEDYQEKVSFFQDLKKSSKFKNFKELYTVHPINFLIDLQRCVLPGPPSANPYSLKKLIQYSIDEITFILGEMLNIFDNWLVNGDSKLDTLFLKWFGYSKVGRNLFYINPVQAKENSDEHNRLEPIFFDLYLDLLEPVKIDDYSTARRVLVETFRQSLRKFKLISINSFWFKNGGAWNLGAMTQTNDINNSITLGMASFAKTAIVDNKKILSSEHFKIPSFAREEDTQILGFVTTLLHETFHLPTHVDNLIDKEIKKYLYSLFEDLYVLRDVYGEYMLPDKTIISLYPYGHEDCQNLAKYLPYAALVNADSYALFLSEFISTSFKRPKIEYLQI